MARKLYGGITRRDLEDAERKMTHLRRRTARDEDKRASLMSKAARTAAVIAGAGASGALQARYGVSSVGPVPVDLVAAGLLLAASYATKGMVSNVLDGASDGALASFATKAGATMGANWRARSGGALPAPPMTAGIGNWDGNGYAPDPYAAGGYPAMPGVPYGAPWNGMPDPAVVDMFRRSGMG